jgi:hypothetical protein
MRFELTTSSLGSWHSTTELRPQSGVHIMQIQVDYSQNVWDCNRYLSGFAEEGPPDHSIGQSMVFLNISRLT